MRLTFYFDYSSPFAYLGATQVATMAGSRGVVLTWHPMLLGAVFTTIGAPMVPLVEMPQVKQAYMLMDLYRYAAKYRVPFKFPSRFPMNTVTALRMTLQVENKSKLALALFKAYWAEDRDINDKDELVDIATKAGFEGRALVDGASEQSVKDMLRANTDAAVSAGVCGAPCYAVDDGEAPPMLFWGQDRAPLVKRALSGWRPDCG